MRACQEVAAQRGIEPAQVAIAWLLSKPVVTAPIIGATKMKHLETAIGAIDVQLTEEEIQKLEAPYRQHWTRGFEV